MTAVAEHRVVAARPLHARPASLLANAAAGFDADVSLHVGAARADAKSVLALLALDIAIGDEVIVAAAGPQADAAVSEIAAQLTEAEAHHA